MPLLIDSQNVVPRISLAPDRLRGQIGLYYTRSSNGSLRPPKNLGDGTIKRFEIVDEPDNDLLLIPTRNHKILIIGDESRFRDYNQWQSYVQSTIKDGAAFLDHQFNFEDPRVTYDFIKNYHHPEYEDNTKEYPSNQLLNYNLLSSEYINEVDTLRRIGQLRTKFDSSPPDIERLLREFANRIENYEGDSEEISTKQRNIFLLGRPATFKITRNQDGSISSPFPFSHKIRIGRFQSPVNFLSILREHKKTKNLFQSIKTDLSFNYRSFTTSADESINAKIYNGVSLLTSTSLSRFSEGSDELFLLEKDNMNHSEPSERFLNQLSTVRFLSDFRKSLLENTRDIHKIFDCNHCEYFRLGYKIEKYLDNDATSPIQTYYTTSAIFDDTQLKYGRRYIYKIKALIGIFGSEYRYTNLNFAEEEPSEQPTDFQVDGEKFWASVNVEVRPSMRILEYEIDRHEIAFVDSPTLAPTVEMYGRKNESCVNFLFRPNYNSVGQTEAHELAAVGNLRPSDSLIDSLYEISGEKRTSHKYFTGIYEIYRMTTPPASKDAFANYFLTTVDQSATYEYISQGLADEEVDMTNAFFKDVVVPNKKYYYAFRAVTYHGTPSQLTAPLEIEVMKDSDEYKISIKEHHYEADKNYKFEKSLKRLIRIVPNPERLVFDNLVNTNVWDLDEGTLATVKSRSYKTFKIRVTSKHTGKKMDLNVTFKVKKDDSFN